MDYVMHHPFGDALPCGVYFNKYTGSLKVHPRNSRTFDGLFADDVWPGSIVTADFLSDNADLCKGLKVLELGAGTALPSLVACRLGAEQVVITDFPDPTILDNIRGLLLENEITNYATVVGHQWGCDCSPVLAPAGGLKFDVVILTELLWRDTAPVFTDILKSTKACLSDNGVALVCYGIREAPDFDSSKYCRFFDIARDEFGFFCSVLLETNCRDTCSTDAVQVKLFALYLQRTAIFLQKLMPKELSHLPK